jgi:hypothetical protein
MDALGPRPPISAGQEEETAQVENILLGIFS